jgi:acetylornithine deacetylase
MNALDYARELVAFDSTSSRSNAAVSDRVEEELRRLGFATERVEYADRSGVRKVNVLGKLGEGNGGLAYFAHTDVVPADSWFTDEHGPFTPAVKDGRLYGRGSADMKGSLASMLAAASRFSARELKAPLYVTATADEEVGYAGALEVAARSRLYREMVQGRSRGIIGEPTRLEVVHAHKATIGFVATSRGRAAHSSTREGLNANLAMIPFLVEMKRIHDETESDPAWRHDAFDPPTVSWNIGINDHTRAVKITAPQSICTVYFRVMPGQDAGTLLERARRAAAGCGLEFEVTVSGEPLWVDPESDFVREALELAGKDAPRTVAYGTDANAFGSLERLIVLGPGDIAQAHTHDEWIALAELERGTDLYARMIERWCA